MSVRIREVLSDRGRFAPLSYGHPSIGQACVACDGPIKAGHVVALVNGAPADEDEAVRAGEGRAYTAVAELAHEGCVPKELWPA